MVGHPGSGRLREATLELVELVTGAVLEGLGERVVADHAAIAIPIPRDGEGIEVGGREKLREIRGELLSLGHGRSFGLEVLLGLFQPLTGPD